MGDAQRKHSPSEVRQLLIMMTDDEIEDLLLFFRLGLLHFYNELGRAEEESGSRPGR